MTATETESAAAGGTEPTDRLAFEDWMSKGAAAYDRAELARARHAFEAAVALAPRARETRLWLCRVAYREFNWRDLWARANALLDEHPEDREVALLKARAANGLGDWEVAADAWRDVVDDRPDWPEAVYQQARAFVRLGRDREAEALAQSLVAKEGLEAQAFAARLFLELYAFPKARSALEALFHDAPDVAAREVTLMERQNDLRGLAVALCARREAEGAAESFAEARLSRCESLFASAIRNERAGDLLAAFMDYDALLLLSPDDNLALRSRERIARELGARALEALDAEDADEAAEAFSLAIRAAPDDTSLRRNHGRLLMNARMWDEAAATWAALAEKLPEDREAALQSARALDRSGRLGEAALAWTRVLELAPDNLEASENMATLVRRMIFAGRAAIAEDRFGDAFTLFKAVLARDPENEEATRRLQQVGRNLLKTMRSLYKVRDLRAVLRHGPAAAETLPNEPEVWLLIARAGEGMRRHETALEAWSHLAAVEPSQGHLARLHAARCLINLSRAPEAERIAIQLIEDEPEDREAQALIEQLRSASEHAA